MDRPPDVLQFLWAEVLEVEIDFVGDLVMDDARDIDAARLGKRLDPGRDIDAVAEHIAALDDDVAEIDADPQRDAPLGCEALVVCYDGVADRSPAACRLNDALEFDKRQIPGLFEQIAVVFGDQRPN